MTAIRVRGWLTDGTIKAPADTVQAMAELAGTVRDQARRIAALETVRDAAEAWLKAYVDHPEDSEECRNAHRALVAAVKGAG